LTAQNLGLAVQPLSQCLEEYPAMKPAYKEFYKNYAASGETLQMLARIGQPAQAAPHSMRQDVMSFIAK